MSPKVELVPCKVVVSMHYFDETKASSSWMVRTLRSVRDGQVSEILQGVVEATATFTTQVPAALLKPLLMIVQ